MNISKFVLLCASAAALTQIGWSQQATSAPGIPGYLDSKSGVVRSAPPKDLPEIESLAGLLTTTGRFVTNFTINVASALPTTAVITCTVNATVFEATTGQAIVESATAQATRKGSAATCAVSIPYSFNLSTPASDSVNLTYIISGGNLPTTTTIPFLSRLSEQPIGSIKVPSNGSTITNNVKSTI